MSKEWIICHMYFRLGINQWGSVSIPWCLIHALTSLHSDSIMCNVFPLYAFYMTFLPEFRSVKWIKFHCIVNKTTLFSCFLIFYYLNFGVQNNMYGAYTRFKTELGIGNYIIFLSHSSNLLLITFVKSFANFAKQFFLNQ